MKEYKVWLFGIFADWKLETVMAKDEEEVSRIIHEKYLDNPYHNRFNSFKIWDYKY